MLEWQSQLAEGVGFEPTDRLNTDQTILWVKAMNSIRTRAEENVLAEVIYESRC